MLKIHIKFYGNTANDCLPMIQYILLTTIVGLVSNSILCVNQPTCPLPDHLSVIVTVCEKYLSQYPADRELLWEVESVGGPNQRTKIANKIQAVGMSGK